MTYGVTAGRISRRSLLEIARGGVSTSSSSSPTPETATARSLDPSSSSSGRVRRCFRLQRQHIGNFGTPAPTPSQFHSVLCDKIRAAQKRVYLASLYIGPAADPAVQIKEVELLDVLKTISTDSSSAVEVKILLDHNRALRPVPVGPNKNTTSAEACRQALLQPVGGDDTPSADRKIHLFKVLPPALQRILPNPVNEVAGVFHIKAYIVDDDLILSGANLSEEYFTDRTDRYMWICKGGAGLVDCYADLVKALCEHADEYQSSANGGNDGRTAAMTHNTAPSEPLLTMLERVLTVDATAAAAEDLLPLDDMEDSETVAYAVPTFQAPAHFQIHPTLTSDVETMHQLVKAAGKDCSLHMATAYLNPTDAMIAACRHVSCVHMLTAGRVSHGFKPKKKAGNKGKDWIPTVFSVLSANSAVALPNSRLWYYQRPDWTFHAKGLWMSAASVAENGSRPVSPRIASDTSLYMATHGSGNYGARTELRDMESNLLLILPANSPLQETFRDEWNSFCEFADPTDSEPDKPLAWHLRTAIPYMRPFM